MGPGAAAMHPSSHPWTVLKQSSTVAPVKRVVFYEESTGWGGTENYLFALASRTAASGFEPHLLVRVLHPSEEDGFVSHFDGASVEVQCLRGALESAPTEIRRLRTIFRSLAGPETIVHFNQQTPASMTTAILAARLGGCATRVATNHLPVLGRPSHNLVGDAIYRMARRSLTLSIFESHENLEIAVRHGLVRRSAARVVLHGVDTASFQPAKAIGARDPLGILPEAFVIGSVGRLEPQKSHDVLVRAFGDFLSQQSELDPHLVLAGDGPERDALERLVRELRLESRVHFLGHVEANWALYRSFDVFALASAWEGLPFSLLEAMASGLPVVATDVGGVRDAIVGGVNGLLVTAGGTDDLAAALFSLTDPARRDQLGRRARADAVRCFDVRRMVDETVVVYDEGIAMTARGGSSN
jgi:glycosyltransferase involved in cell wall biosynthesis